MDPLPHFSLTPILRELLQKLPDHIFPVTVECLLFEALSPTGIGHSFWCYCHRTPLSLLIWIILCFHLSLSDSKVIILRFPSTCNDLSFFALLKKVRTNQHVFNPLDNSPGLVGTFCFPKVLTKRTDIFCYQDRYLGAHLTGCFE